MTRIVEREGWLFGSAERTDLRLRKGPCILENIPQIWKISCLRNFVVVGTLDISEVNVKDLWVSVVRRCVCANGWSTKTPYVINSES